MKQTQLLALAPGVGPLSAVVIHAKLDEVDPSDHPNKVERTTVRSPPYHRIIHQPSHCPPSVGVGVDVDVYVDVDVAVGVGVDVGVGVGVDVTVGDGVGVDVRADVGVDVITVVGDGGCVRVDVAVGVDVDSNGTLPARCGCTAPSVLKFATSSSVSVSVAYV